ncbi:MAG: hypothetical protein A2133_07015 [Actinobacteria bacterium RBG_16_64_13]|nr:MAG: hypothetical protein A2133_07015 [Actinobacteria bacterium RBG_16_64_13]
MSELTESRSTKEQLRRQPYQAPQLARVNLEAEEVLAIGCKMVTHSSAAASPVNCTIRGCAKAGS